jgi:hypothetical protein
MRSSILHKTVTPILDLLCARLVHDRFHRLRKQIESVYLDIFDDAVW